MISMGEENERKLRRVYNAWMSSVYSLRLIVRTRFIRQYN